VSPEHVERKLAAILAADVAGYSRIMGVDEEGTLSRLKAHRRELIDPKVAEHRGRVVKTTGDGILIEFPSVVDAVRCAVDVQRGMAERNAESSGEKRIEFRVGINLGDIIIDGDDIYGDGVNIAARLEGLAEPNGICVSRVVRDQVRDKLDLAFEDMGEQQVKNIARPIRVFRIAATAIGHRASSAKPALALPDKPSIAVLPFQNMSGEPEQEFFADGTVEEIITALSRFRSLFVIARNSSFAYKGKSPDIRQVGRELGVRYVLEGSVRRAGNRLRITAQLVDATTGNHIWAERYDRDATDVFAVQDEITSSVATAIQPALEQTERDRALRKPPDSLDAWESYQRGLWHFLKADAQENERSRGFFKRALALDPGFAPAHAGLALTYAWDAIFFNRDSQPRVVPLCEEQARKCISLDPMEPSGHMVLSTDLVFLDRRQEAVSEANIAVAINPNYAWAHGFLGSALTWTERPLDAIAPLERAIRLSPFDPMTWKWLHNMVQAYFYSHELEPAIATARELIRMRPELRFPQQILVSALGHLGRYEEARAAFAQGIARHGKIFEEKMRVPSGPPVSAANDEYELEGFRKAGVIEADFRFC
jgi:adenylate cyclase